MSCCSRAALAVRLLSRLSVPSVPQTARAERSHGGPAAHGGVAHHQPGRDGATCKKTLDALEAGARGDANLMPLIMEAVKARATLGEISERLRTVFGVFEPARTF